MKKLFIIALVLVGCSDEPDAQSAIELMWRGGDLSFQPELEEKNVQYFDSENNRIDPLETMVSKGMNLVRLRLWHTPEEPINNLEAVIDYGCRAKAAGAEILLDFHYSDTWADPGKQAIPQAWAGLDQATLQDSIYLYTRRVMQAFKNAGCSPGLVQIGNETNSGFLWNMGKVGGDFNNNWSNYARLVNYARRGIREVEPETEIMLHFAGIDGAEWYFSNLNANGVEYDLIGLSYYSKWHGNNLEVWQDKLYDFAGKFSQKIMIVEAAYPWTMDFADSNNNLFGLEDDLVDGYPATPEGQQQFFKKLREIIHGIPGNKGIGFCYWAPDWVSDPNRSSAWENTATFDFEHKPLPVLDEFN